MKAFQLCMAGLITGMLTMNAVAAENQIIKAAIGDTIETYRESGVQGLVESVRLCYEETYKETGNMYCVIHDMSSKAIDDMGVQGLGVENQEMFETPVFGNRMNSACKLLLKRSKADCNAFLPKTFKSVYQKTLKQLAQ